LGPASGSVQTHLEVRRPEPAAAANDGAAGQGSRRCARARGTLIAYRPIRRTRGVRCPYKGRNELRAAYGCAEKRADMAREVRRGLTTWAESKAVAAAQKLEAVLREPPTLHGASSLVTGPTDGNVASARWDRPQPPLRNLYCTPPYYGPRLSAFFRPPSGPASAGSSSSDPRGQDRESVRAAFAGSHLAAQARTSPGRTSPTRVHDPVIVGYGTVERNRPRRRRIRQAPTPSYASETGRRPSQLGGAESGARAPRRRIRRLYRGVVRPHRLRRRPQPFLRPRQTAIVEQQLHADGTLGAAFPQILRNRLRLGRPGASNLARRSGQTVR
jgi:hypothetical protein